MKIINSDKKFNTWINPAIITGSTGIGLLGGYSGFKIKSKTYNAKLQTQLQTLKNENETILLEINKSCLNSAKSKPEYKNKIDTLEKEGKIFGQDYHLKDILKPADLANYNKNLKDFYNTIKENETEIINLAAKKLSKIKQKYLITGTVTGLLISSIGVITKKFADKKITGVDKSAS